MARPSIVLLPGLLCDEAVWPHQREALAAFGCTVPSYGALDSIEAMAAHALESAPAGKLAVAGHSMGGRVALEMARQAPWRIDRIALLDTGITPLPQGEAAERERAGRLALLAIARSEGMRAMGRSWAQGMVHPARLGSALFEEILEMIERKTPAIFEAQIRALLGRPDARGVCAGLRCPTLILCGRQDAWSTVAQHEEMHALLPGSRLAIVEDSGHMSTMEQPEAVSDALLQWMEQ